LKNRASDPANGILEKVRFIELGSLTIALAECTFTQTSHFRLGFGVSGRHGRGTKVMAATIALLLRAVHAQQEFGQCIVVSRRDACSTVITAVGQIVVGHVVRARTTVRWT